jgi:predicted transcriptional regulator
MKQRTKMMTSNRQHRDRVSTYRAVLEYLSTSERPIAEWRLLYAVRGASQYFREIRQELRKYEFIKTVPLDNKMKKLNSNRKYGTMGTVETHNTKYVTVTPKGLKFLRLTSELATLMPTAPWILENAS